MILYENTSYNNQLSKMSLPPVVTHQITADIQNFFTQTLRDLFQETSDYPRALYEICFSFYG
jgi:hypothetical protein